MTKGMAIYSGSTPVHKILEDGTVSFSGSVGITGSLTSSNILLNTIGNVTEPTITFLGSGSSDPIELKVTSGSSLSFEGSAGQLLSITNNLTSGTIFSVNDVTGIPLLEADADGTVSIARFGTKLGVGTNNPTSTLTVSGTFTVTGSSLFTAISGTNATFVSITGSGGGITNLTASNINNFTSDVRSQFSAGTNIDITNGVISVTGAVGGGGSTPGGPEYSVQFNSGSDLSGSSLLTYNYNTNVLSGTIAEFTGVSSSYLALSSSTEPDQRAGTIFYDNTNNLLRQWTEVQDVDLHLGQQLAIRVKNDSGILLTKGKVVHITGSTNSDTPLVTKASYESDSVSADTLGVLMADIAIAGTGYALLYGILTGIELSSYASGDMLYLSSSGDFSNVAPLSPLHEVRIGQVTRATSNGAMFVRIQNGYEIDELHDVLISSKQNGDLLSWDSGSLVWKNTKTLSGSYKITQDLTASNISLVVNDTTAEPTITFNGSSSATPIELKVKSDSSLSFEGTEGTLLYISDNLTSGTIFSVNDGASIPLIEVDANGTVSMAEFAGNVGIGTASPQYKLDVNGTLRASGNSFFQAVSGTTATFSNYISGTTGQFTTVSASVFTGSTGLLTTLTASNAYVSGNLGVGTASPTDKLEVAGTLRFPTIEGGTAIRVDGGGNSDTTIFRVDATNSGSSNSGDHGFSLKYMGVRAGNDNSLSIFSDNQTSGTQIEALTILQDGKVGIGTASPNYKLSVTGTMGVSDDLVVGADSLYVDVSADRLGVALGGALPSASLHIRNNTARILLESSTNPTSYNLEIVNNYNAANRWYLGGSNGAFKYIGNINVPSSFASSHTFLNDYYGISFHAGGGATVPTEANTRMVIRDTGLVGIGTTTPEHTLSVTGTLGVSGVATFSTITASNVQITNLDVDTITAREYYTELVSSSIIYESGSTKFGDTSDDVHSFTGSINMVSGNLTIGAPNENINRRITIHGSSTFNKLCFLENNGNGLEIGHLIANQILSLGSSTQNWQYVDHYASTGHRFKIGAAEKVIIDVNGNVGIGTSSPGELLDVRTSTVTAGQGARIGEAKIGTWEGGTSYAAFTHNTLHSTPNSYALLQGDDGTTALNTASGRSLLFKNNNNTNMAISSTGNVGIGTTSPSAKLEVSGSDILVNGITIGRGSGNLDGNTAVGVESLLDNTTGTSNTAVGWRSLTNNTTGTSNVAIGINALFSNTTTSWNTAVGYASLLNNTVNSNTGFGYEAGRQNSTGTGIVAVGYQALRNNTSSDNTAVGYQAGTAITTGTGNTLLGKSAGSSITTGSNNTLIGTYAGTNTMSNHIVLSDGAGNQRLWIDSDGNIGVGTTSPSAKLDLAIYSTTPALRLRNGDGSSTFTRPQIALSFNNGTQYNHFIHTRHNSAGATGNAIDFYVCDSTSNNSLTSGVIHNLTLEGGNVGIGLTNPASKLEVYNGIIRSRTNTNNAGFHAIKPDAWSLDAFVISDGTNPTMRLKDRGSAAGFVELVSDNGRDLVVATQANAGKQLTLLGSIVKIKDNDAPFPDTVWVENDKVGIGTTATPTAKLEVVGNTTISGTLNISGSIIPNGDGTHEIGAASNRFGDVYAVQTTVGAVFETGLTTKGIEEYPTGTVLVWKDGKLKACDKNEDDMVMGVGKHGKQQPIILGAEPVLVTGKVEEGDWIVTSDKLGHGKAFKRKWWKRNTTGKIIAQALESCDGESNLIKCMINRF